MPGSCRSDTCAGGTLDGYDPGTDAEDYPVEALGRVDMGRDGGEVRAEGDRGQRAAGISKIYVRKIKVCSFCSHCSF